MTTTGGLSFAGAGGAAGAGNAGLTSVNAGGISGEPKLPPGLVPPRIKPCGPNDVLPNILICFKKPKKDAEKASTKSGLKSDDEDENIEGVRRKKKRSKSRELRSSILYVGCDCEKRNGLQDDCPRAECRGSPACLTVPPTCGPSEFSNGKHLQRKIDLLLKKKAELEEKKNKPKEDQSDVRTILLKSDYDCFRLNTAMPGSQCPLCESVFDSKPKPIVAPNIYVGPINLTMPKDCECCPGPPACA